MRQRGNTPERKPGLLLVIESEEEVLSDSLIESLKALAGVEHFAIKPHPYLTKLGISDALNRHSDVCDFSDFWDSIPEVAVSLGSSSTFELVYLGVPVITVYPESFESDYFPSAGTYLNTTKGVSQALQVIGSVLDHKEERDSLLRNQQQELSEMLADAPKSLKRIVSFILAQTFHA
jgi:ABC-type Fe3+-hydroxamate transport system substrate-binding protein